MKRIALIVVAVMFAAAANAQFALGLQGGYYGEKSVNSWKDDFHKSATWLAGLQAGYKVTPKLYVGVMGGYLSTSSEAFNADTNNVDLDHVGQPHNFTNLDTVMSRSGWTVQPFVRYEIFKYGNIHFHLMLQGNIRSMGYQNMTTSYNTYKNNNEYIEADPVDDSVRNFSWSISLRPTVTYEFSKHLSAELSLDFLSVGYIVDKTYYDVDKKITDPNVVGGYHMVGGEKVQDVYTTKRFYAGLNTLMESLRWESPLLRFGFNYTF